MAVYNGYKLSAKCDSARLTSLTTALNGLLTTLDDAITAARTKFTDLETYAAEDPSVSISLDDSCLDTIKKTVSDANDTALSTIKSILAAIEDFSDGEWSDPNNKVFLDNFLAANGKNPAGPPSGGPGGPGGSGGELPSTESDENLLANETVADFIQSTVPLEETTTTNDEEIVLGQTESVAGEYDSSVVVPFAGSNDEKLDISDNNIEGGSSELGTSLFGNNDSLFGGNGSFSVPSMLSSDKKISGVKGAGILGAAGIAAAAAAAIGGKAYYDKKHNSDEEEDDEFIDEDLARLNEESGSDVSNGFMSGLSSVEFKSELLGESDGDL